MSQTPVNVTMELIREISAFAISKKAAKSLVKSVTAIHPHHVTLLKRRLKSYIQIRHFSFFLAQNAIAS